MKQFFYFENTEGGMEVHEKISGPEYFHKRVLYGWMDPDVEREDKELLWWMGVAAVGDFYYHRLGVIVRVGDVIDASAS